MNGTPIHPKGLPFGPFQYFGTVEGKLTLFALWGSVYCSRPRQMTD